MGQLDGRWYCLDCWADHADRPVEEMSAPFGPAGKAAPVELAPPLKAAPPELTGAIAPAKAALPAPVWV